MIKGVIDLIALTLMMNGASVTDNNINIDEVSKIVSTYDNTEKTLWDNIDSNINNNVGIQNRNYVADRIRNIDNFKVKGNYINTEQGQQEENGSAEVQNNSTEQGQQEENGSTEAQNNSVEQEQKTENGSTEQEQQEETGSAEVQNNSAEQEQQAENSSTEAQNNSTEQKQQAENGNTEAQNNITEQEQQTENGSTEAQNNITEQEQKTENGSKEAQNNSTEQKQQTENGSTEAQNNITEQKQQAENGSTEVQDNSTEQGQQEENGNLEAQNNSAEQKQQTENGSTEAQNNSAEQKQQTENGSTEAQNNITEQGQQEENGSTEAQNNSIEQEQQAQNNSTEQEVNLLYDFVISSYTTKYSQSKGNYNRNFNMELASDSIDGIILNPGDIFSYNDVILSHRTPERDYLMAGVISGGKIVDGIGGGICQISSTLYNTALLADMTIVERRNHSQRVGYLPAGRDATASWGSIDFKFKNELSVPVKIDSKIGGGVLEIKLLAQKDPQIGNVEINVGQKDGVYYLKRYVNGINNYNASSRYAK